MKLINHIVIITTTAFLLASPISNRNDMLNNQSADSEAAKTASLSCRDTDSIYNMNYEHDIGQAYLNVLLDRTEIFRHYSVSQDKLLKLTDYLHLLASETIYSISHFAVIDMNGDGVKDIILSVELPIISVGYISIVLIYEKGVVYSSFYTMRNMFDIKKDGTFFASFEPMAASGHWNVIQLQFSSGVFGYEEVRRSPNYYVFHKEFWSFAEEQDKKEDVEWVPYSTETIEEYFTTAWQTAAQQQSLPRYPPIDFPVEPSFEINGTPVIFPDQQPIGASPLVPVRGLFEAMGFTVDWNPDMRQAILKNNDNTVFIAEGSEIFTVSGMPYAHSHIPAQIINGRMMVGFRAVLESVGCTVGWDGERNTVVVTPAENE